MMKKTAKIIAASLLLAACNAIPNASEKAVMTQNMQNTAWDKQYGARINPTIVACLPCVNKLHHVLRC